MNNEQMTVSEYSVCYDVPRSTVKGWIRRGLLKADKSRRPMLIAEGQTVPQKDPDIHRWRYQWK